MNISLKEWERRIQNAGLTLTFVFAGLLAASQLRAAQSPGVVVAWGSFDQNSVPSGLKDVVSVAAGYSHALALKSDGTVVGWGQSAYGAATPPAGLSNVVAVAAGTDISAALKSDGSAVTWGYFGPIPGLNGLTAIGCGYAHMVALKSNKTVIAWGHSDYGQTAVPVGLSNVVAIAVGTYHSLALKGDGTVVGWGRNDYGQCNPPVGLSNVVAVAGGNYHSTALKSDGTVVCWGANWAFSDISNQAIPPAGLSNVVAIAAGAYHNLAAKADGTLVAWGWAAYGLTNIPESLTGVGAFSASLSFNLAVTANPYIYGQPNDTAAYVGATAQFGIKSTGNGPLSYQWQFQGQDISGATHTQLTLPGVQTTNTGQYQVIVSNPSGTVTSHVAHLNILLTPMATVMPDSALVVEGGAVRFEATACGQLPLHFQWQFNNLDLGSATDAALMLTNIQTSQAGGYSVVLTNDFGDATSASASLTVLPAAQVLGWGQGWNGELNMPSGLNDVISLAAGRDHSLALRADGTVAAWGTDYFGQSDVPSGLSNVVAIAAGGGFSLALQNDGTVREWGESFGANISLPNGLTNVTAIAAGLTHAVALRRDGRVVAWGSISNVPFGLVNVASVGAGSGFCLALRSNGTVVAWGDNTLGQCNVPAGLTNIVAIVAGHSHSLALRRNGTVVGWGLNDSGQLDVPQTVSNVVAIAAGYQHSIALKDDGLLVAWGSNQLGQSPRWIGLTGVRSIAAGKLSSFSLAAIDFPRILTAPTNQLVVRGGRASFSVIATDTSPLNYHWQFLGTNIPGATNATLTLDDIEGTQAGIYTVIVANGFGNSVQAQARLSVVEAPVVTTSNPSGFNGDATLKGTVNPNGAETTAWFEWGTSTNYGNLTATAYPGSETANVGVLYHLAGLTPGAAYHYRLVATNIAGRSNGQDVIYESPRIVLLGANPITNECHNPFTDPGAAVGARPLALAGSLSFSLALNSDRTVTAWGYDGFGQLDIPMGLSNVVAISSQAASDSCLALKADGTVVGWGDNRIGQTSIPAGLSNVTAIVAAHFHSLALKTDGTVVAWGANWTGTDPQSDIPPGLTNVTAIAAGNFYSLALKSDGTLVGWGYDINGVLEIPPGLSNVTQIVGGWDFAVALKSDGTVVGWGGDLFGQTDIPMDLSNVTSIAAGYGFGLALKADGTVMKWGWDGYIPDVSVPVGLSNVVAIAAGDYHVLALKSDGSIVGWGSNAYGELDIPTNVIYSPLSVTVSGLLDVDSPGVYTLTYSAVNSMGIVGSATRSVVVTDTTPPTLVCPTNLTVEFVSETGTPVNFTPEAIDLCSTFVTVICTPASGSIFPIGTTSVFCTATDDSGNSASCGFQITVLGAQGICSNVLTELITLRKTAIRPRDRESLEEAILHLSKSLEATFWVDQTHPTRRDGMKVFNRDQAAVAALSRLMKGDHGTIPDAIVQALLDRVVKADRLLAVVSIEDAVASGAAPATIAELWDLMADGDGQAGKSKYEDAIGHYQDAWLRALRHSVGLTGRLTNGKLHLEFPGFPRDTYFIEASTNLMDWTVVGAGTIGAAGVVQFEDADGGRYKARFYRVRFAR